MKQIKFLILTILYLGLFSSCNKHEDPNGDSFYISIEEAIEISKNIEITTKEISTRSDSYEVISSKTLKGEDSEDIILILNQKKDEILYFSIISLDSRTLPILGFGHGSFSLEEISKETMYWLNGQIRLVKYVKNNNISKETFVKDIAKVNDEDIVGPTTDNPCDNPWFGGSLSDGPLMNHTWGQGCVYNAQCPDLDCDIGFCDVEQAWVGCVATAMAQIMGYHSSPSNYNWSDIQLRYNWNDFGDPGADDIALLMSDAGEAIDMQYDCDGSGAFTSEVPEVLENDFGYSNGGQWYDNSWDDFGWNEWASIRRNIREDKPVILRGAGERGGHAWVCDGYRQEWGCENGKPWSTLFLHMNWGWNGTANGWFVGYGQFPEGSARILDIEP